MTPLSPEITHLLLDIEGTTCPVSFVAEVLFPYARARLSSYCEAHAQDPELQDLLQAVDLAWASDTHPDAQALRLGQDQGVNVVPYLEWLIDNDVKLTPLKDLQGRIWEAGYSQGDIVAPLFHDVPAALQQWHHQQKVLAVYSSGSVVAQQLLYGHCQAGDLRGLFSHWFDTRTGLKQVPSSYTAIAGAMGTVPAQVLFFSDSLAEITAAAEAGMAVLFSDREGNPGRNAGPFEKISDYSQIT
jgi:enolase-phosphatase E1